MYPAPNSTASAQMGPYNFYPPQHADLHDGSYSPQLLNDRGLPPSNQVVRPFLSSSAMTPGRGAKEPPSMPPGESSGCIVLPPLPPMSAMRERLAYPSSSGPYQQTLPPIDSYRVPPPPSPQQPQQQQYNHYHRQHESQRLPPAHSLPNLHVAPRHHYGQPQYQHSESYSTLPIAQHLSASPSTPSFGKQSPPARKRSRHAWPADMTRQIINVLLDEFLTDPSFRTTIYRSREERDHRFKPSGRSILEEYNKVQNIRRRYFIPLSYLLQWDQLKKSSSVRNRLRANIEKKLAKPLERSRLQMIFLGAVSRGPTNMGQSLSKSTSSATLFNADDMSGAESEAEDLPMHSASTPDGVLTAKPMFELDIFVTELKRRDPQLWAQGSAAFSSWVSRKSSVDYILN
ncbi:hypothetical protein GGI21_000214 [Coemansia aciculifera]|nr:hypothetical protein GGI21_000214 [Coemansia aciculifera]